MRRVSQQFWYACAVLILWLCFVPSAFSNTVSMTLISPGSNVLGTNVLDGVYVGPYTATINGVSTPVICDDYGDESYIPETWTANVSTFSNLSGAKWAQGQSNQTQLYEEAAWLIQQMYSPANSSQVGEIQFAVWGLFDSSAITNLSSYNSADGKSASNWLTDAGKQSFTPGEFSDFSIYTTPSGATPTCGGSPCPSSPPQEFMTYSTPEPSVVIILAADLLLFGLAVVFLRRRGYLAFSD